MTSELNNQTNSNTAYNLAVDLLTTYKNKYGLLISTHERAHVLGEWVFDELIERFSDINQAGDRLVDEYDYEDHKYFNKEDWDYALITLEKHLPNLMGDLKNKDKIEKEMNEWQREILDYSYDKTLNILLNQVKKCFSDHDCDITCEDSIRDFFSRIPRYIDADFKENTLNTHTVD